METQKTVLWVIIGILLLAVIYTVFFKSPATGNSVNSNSQIDTSGWTENEIMNYEMHGTIPTRASVGASLGPSSSGMVGGC